MIFFFFLRERMIERKICMYLLSLLGQRSQGEDRNAKRFPCRASKVDIRW